MGQNMEVSRPRIAGIVAIHIVLVSLVVCFILAEVLVLLVSMIQVKVATWRIWAVRLVDVGLIVLNVAVLVNVMVKTLMVGLRKATWEQLDSTLWRYFAIVFFGNVFVWILATVLSRFVD